MEDEFIKTYIINSIEELFSIIKGNTNFIDLRQDFIFRGLSDESYELIPSSLRDCDESNINNFISSDFNLRCSFDYTEYLKFCKLLGYDVENIKINESAVRLFNINKDLERIDSSVDADGITCVSDIYYKKEIYVLLKFLNYADKSGLKVPFNQKIRESIHLKSDYRVKRELDYWPHPDYFEIISLAQHYGVPTRSLDWSYDYKVALYFAVKDILEKDNAKDVNCVLWAFNYKKFNVIDKSPDKSYIPLHFYYYRPEYKNNPNLNAQQGLFTFWCNYFEKEDVDLRPFNDIIVDKLKNSQNISDSNDCIKKYEIDMFTTLCLNDNEKLFYKFIIPGCLKSKLLKELYSDGYSEEYLFPGYFGVSKVIKNKVKLEEILE